VREGVAETMRNNGGKKKEVSGEKREVKRREKTSDQRVERSKEKR
jgi:hypothetical protein